MERQGYGVRETAAALDRHPNSIYTAIKNGTIPARRLGHKYIVPAEFVESFGRVDLDGESKA